LTKEFTKELLMRMKNLFYEKQEIKRNLIGGPIPTKDGIY